MGRSPILSTAPPPTTLHPPGPTPQDLHQQPGARGKVGGPCDVDQLFLMRRCHESSQVQRLHKVFRAPKVIEGRSQDFVVVPKVSEGGSVHREGGSVHREGGSVVFDCGLWAC